MLALLVCGPHVRENCCKETELACLELTALFFQFFCPGPENMISYTGFCLQTHWPSITLLLRPYPSHYISKHVSSMGLNNPALSFMTVTKA